MSGAQPADTGRAPSLRRVLLVWLLLPMALLVPFTAALIYALALRPALDGLDRALTDTAVALAQIVEVHGDRATLPLSAQTARALQADPVDQVFFAVGDAQGQLLGGLPALLQLGTVLPRGHWRFFEATLAGQPVRVAVHAVGCGPAATQVCTILVAETLGKRQAAQQAVLLAAVAGALLLALPTLALAWLAVSRGMAPLRRAATDVGSRAPHQLAPIDTRAIPGEVVPFVQALNTLFGRLRDAATAQQAFIADAAHQLRTPLAVLRVEAEQALATPHPSALRPVLMRLHAAAERGARLAQQLLVLARAESSATDPACLAKPVDLAQLARDSAPHWLPPSLRAGQDLGFDLAPAWVMGDALLLSELLGNLIHNAIEHAGRGARITVRTGVLDSGALLSVVDDGPGLTDAEHAVVWQRFRRGQAARGTGSGLGLAIVQDIARLHGAHAALGSGDGGRGLRVSVTFPGLVHSPGGAPVAIG